MENYKRTNKLIKEGVSIITDFDKYIDSFSHMAKLTNGKEKKYYEDLETKARISKVKATELLQNFLEKIG